MHEPIRLKPVTVMLDVYRQAIVALGDALAGAGAMARRVGRRACAWAISFGRRAFGAPGEALPSHICARLRAAKRRGYDA